MLGAVDAVDGACGGKIFPFGGFAVISVFVVARLEVVVGLGELAASHDAATDAGAKGEVNAAVIAAAYFGKRGEVAVVLDVSGFSKIFREFLSEIEVFPGEIAEPSAFIVFDDARHRDAKSDHFVEDEIDANLLAKVIIKGVLVGAGREFDGMQDFALAVYEGDEGFGAANVDTEIHVFIIADVRQG